MRAVSATTLGGRYFHGLDSNTDTLGSELTEKGTRGTIATGPEKGPADGRVVTPPLQSPKR